MASAIVHLGRTLARLRSTDVTKIGKTFLNIRHFHAQCISQGIFKLEMPSLSPTMTEGTIVKWHKKEGDPVSPGDELCDIQTDKAVVTMDTDEEGVLAKILMPDNSKDIKVGTLIAVMVEEGDDWQNVEVPKAQAVSASTSDQSPVQDVSQSQQEAPITGEMHTGPIGPSVRKLLEEYNIPANKITGSGRNGWLTKGDVLQYIHSHNLQKQSLLAESKKSTAIQQTSTVDRVPPPAPPPPPSDGEEFTDIQLTGMRKTIAKRLTESKTTIPHSYMSIESNMGAVTQLRKEMIANNVKVSMNDFVIKASAIALQRVPRVNSVWQGDTPQASTNVDISVAVATDQGLITPIVKNAAFLPVDEISSTVKELAGRAREGKLQLHEFQGGSFTISNLGMFGISEFTAVINPPQTAIMAVGGSRMVVGRTGKPQSNLTVNLSYDSRVIDETEASQFLEVFKEIMENPSLMVIGTPKSGMAEFA